MATIEAGAAVPDFHTGQPNHMFRPGFLGREAAGLWVRVGWMFEGSIPSMAYHFVKCIVGGFGAMVAFHLAMKYLNIYQISVVSVK